MHVIHQLAKGLGGLGCGVAIGDEALDLSAIPLGGALPRATRADPQLPALPGELDPSTNTLKRDGKLILDESDSYGVEMALQLVKRAKIMKSNGTDS